MRIDFIITTLNKSQEELCLLLDKTNIKGHILIGNQGQKFESSYKITKNEYEAIVYNEITTGVSLNRNFLLSKSDADFVIFLDDDVIIKKDIEITDFGKVDLDAVRFNCVSNNFKRPIKAIKKNKFLKFKDIKSYGVWGIFFNRKFLIDNNLKFDEEVGPGRFINHGEDTLFLKKYLEQGGTIIQNIDVLFTISQEESTWKDGDIERELLSHGFIYKKIFGKIGKIYLYYYFLKHNKEIRKEHNDISLKFILKTLKKGYKGDFERKI